MEAFIADHLWQSTLFGCAAAILVWTMKGCPARVRHAIWTAASVKFLIPFSLLIGLGASVKPASAPAIISAPVVSAAIEQISQPFSADVRMGAPSGPPAAAEPRGSALRVDERSFAAPILGALWLTGALLLTTWRVRGWRQIAATARTASPVTQGTELDLMTHVADILRVRPRVRLVRSHDMAEPAVLGIFRPTLLWPAALTDRLAVTDIEPIFVHELQHVRRRDNLVALMHMAVETIFWCHPLVWWLGARMVQERELACDEAVIAYGAGRTQYAESLLAVCRLCLASPVRCVSGVSGWNLKRRVEAILTATPRQLALTRKLLLGAAVTVALLCPLAVGFLQARPLTVGGAVETILSPATTLTSPPAPAPPTSAAIAAVDPQPRLLSGRPIDWSALGSQTLSPAPSVADDRAAQPYRFNKSDSVLISVEPPPPPGSNCGKDYVIGADGRINFCVLGAITLAGLSEREAEALIRSEFQKSQLYAAPRPDVSVQAMIASPPHERVVQKSDLLRIESTFSNWVRSVEPDGTISFPSLGTLKVEGLTSRQIENLIERGLTDKGLLGARDRILVEVSGPQSPASPQGAAARPAEKLETVFVNGEVRTPGSTQLKASELTLMHALAAAGNTTPQAGPNIYVLRSPRPRGEGEAQPLSPRDTNALRFKYNRKQLMDDLLDPPIQAGDTIWIEAAQTFIVNGEVKSGGIKIWEPGITVTDAIRLAGGMTDKGSLGRSYISRKNDKGTYDRITGLKVETRLLPKDELVIGRKLF